MWREIWDAVVGKSIVAHVAEALDEPTEATERASPGSWADSTGPGRCPRCRAWLTGPSQTRWMCRYRGAPDPAVSWVMCGDCADSVLASWGLSQWRDTPLPGGDEPR